MKALILVALLFCMPKSIYGNEDFKVVNIKKDTVSLTDLSQDVDLFVVVFTGRYICFDCFKKIITTLDSLCKIYPKLDYIFLGNAESSQERRMQIEKIEQIKETKLKYKYFDAGKVLEKYKIVDSPAVFFLRDGKITSFISLKDFEKVNYKCRPLFKKVIENK